MTATLHIRCGSDIRDGLAKAGRGSDFLEHAAPVCRGLVPAADGEAFRAARLACLDRELGMDATTAEEHLDQEETDLGHLAANERSVFVRETRSTLDSEERRTKENQKITCGRKHFGALGVDFDVITAVTM